MAEVVEPEVLREACGADGGLEVVAVEVAMAQRPALRCREDHPFTIARPFAEVGLDVADRLSDIYRTSYLRAPASTAVLRTWRAT
jgi:hypothetical protein